MVLQCEKGPRSIRSPQDTTESTMGTTASTKSSNTSYPEPPSVKTQQKTANGGTPAPVQDNGKTGENGKTVESPQNDDISKVDISEGTAESKDARKEYLKKKLRSKVRAIAMFRKSVQASSVPDCKEEEEGSGEEEEEPEGEEVKEDNLRSLDILYHPSNNRDELRKFLWQAKQETEDCWDNIQTEDREIEDKYSIYDKKTEDADDKTTRHEQYKKRKKGKISEEQRLPPPMPPVGYICLYFFFLFKIKPFFIIGSKFISVGQLIKIS